MFSAVDVRSVAHYAVTYGRNHSPLGRNLLFCTNRYKCSLIYLGLILVELMVLLLRVFNCSIDSSLQQADFLRECVMVRDGLFTLPNWFLVSDTDAIIDCLCCD